MKTWMTRAGLLCLAFMLGACASSPLAAPWDEAEPLRYNILYTNDPTPRLNVEVFLPRSFQGSVPRAYPLNFLFRQPGRVESLVATAEDGTRFEFFPQTGGAVQVPRGTRVIRYHYPLAFSRGGGGRHLFGGMGEGDAWHVAGKAYLLTPREVTPDMRADLTVSGTDALLPWQPDDKGVYHLRGEDLIDAGFHAFGGRRCQAHVGESVLEVALLGRFTHLKDAEVCAWLEQAGREVLTVRKAFPYPRITVRVVPIPGKSTPGDFGMTQWSSPPSISILVGQDATAASFSRDWVAIHELLHLTHPPLVPREAWLTEGLATYYTELARVRSGRQTSQQAWQELANGFARGQAAARSRPMKEVVAEEGNYMGIYWTGALFALHLDVELRRVTNGRARLDDVLELLATRGPTATLKSFGEAVDTVAGQPLFDALLARHLPKPAFAELKPLLEDLGVKIDPGGVQLHAAPGSALREALDVAP
ncbi:hypothetical protein D7X55_27980 [Corallococcus sp. AB049A]|uniref:Peptidase M61 catalytic domain-containing protein n=1 Tax=Corallococcus interemptor TaxID=2316720 RepID=A0A3A8R1R6_9BACT|nr:MULTISPECIES: hypothetical protein [Corallococcus]RKH69234.1 hypothetical protein D7X96_15475 [Corallococcus interemptor]RKI57081.1 hypothetical protein D7X55_27980 [Corallococcus sp. AB049A]